MFTLLDILLRRIVRRGALTLIDAAGTAHRYGDGTPPAISVRLADRRLERQLVRDPQLALGEAYMHGRLSMVEGGIYDFLELMFVNLQGGPLPGWTMSFSAGRVRLRVEASRTIPSSTVVAESAAGRRGGDATGAVTTSWPSAASLNQRSIPVTSAGVTRPR